MNRALSAGRLLKDALAPREQLNRYLLLNIYGVPLSALWGGLNTIIAPYAIERLVSENEKNTYLGLLLFFGLGVAVITQPFAGSVSDRYGSRAGRRRPFILGSAILDGVFIIAFGLATNFWFAFVAYALLQIVSNFGQAAYQALIPDFAPREERGVASGAKQALEVFGSIVGLGIAGLFTTIDFPWGGYAGLIVLLLIGAYASYRNLREPPVVGQPLFKGITGSSLKLFTYDVRANATFSRLLVARFVFFLGFVSIQRFLLNFLSDVLGLQHPGAWAAGILVLATVVGIVGALTAGSLVDRLGRRRVAFVAAVIAAVYLLPLGIFPNLYLMLALGAVLGLAGGAFAASTWAFLADEIPKGESARFYGIANYATAGAGALGAGIFGVMIDVLNGWKYIAGYRALILVSAALLVVCLPILPPERPTQNREDAEVPTGE
jgi:MFS family permease